MNEGNVLSKCEELMETAVQWLLQDGINIGKAILMALIIFVVGRWIAGAIKNKLRSTMEKWNVDPALISFGTSIIYYVLMIAVVLAVVPRLASRTPLWSRYLAPLQNWRLY